MSSWATSPPPQVQVNNVRIVPGSTRPTDNSQSYRVYVGRAEVCAAWSKNHDEGRPYLTVKLDDPSFSAPILANLVGDEDGDEHT